MTVRRLLWLGIFLGVLLWSAVLPKDRYTWILEVAPAVIGLILIGFTWDKFRLTPLLYVLILIHAVVLMVGGHYTYAEVPLFDWIKQLFDLERNNYDKLGPFMQEFAPAILAREILLRLSVINGRGWTAFIVVSICLAFSALYELIEWAVAVMVGSSAEAFLGTQGYVWDTQADMAFALVGAILALVTLSSMHDKQLGTVTGRTLNR